MIAAVSATLAPFAHGIGEIDLTFGDLGIVSHTEIERTGVSAVGEANDGRILTAGWTGSGHYQYRFRAMLADGSGDPDYGGGSRSGTVIYKMGKATAVAGIIGLDGSAIVNGFSQADGGGGGVFNDTSNGGIVYATVVKYDPAGNYVFRFYPENNFGLYGTSSKAICQQADGKIIVVAQGLDEDGDNSPHTVIYRLTSAGKIDPTFNSTGYRIFDPGGNSSSIPSGVGIMPDGKIAVSGTVKTSENYRRPFLTMLTSTGQTVTTFGTNGIVYTIPTKDIEFSRGLTIDPSGRILSFGLKSTGSSWKPHIARHFSDGRIDTSFGGAGSLTLNYDRGRVNDILCLPSGRLAVAIDADEGPIIWLKENGSSETSYGNNGTTKIDARRSGKYDTINDLSSNPLTGNIFASIYSSPKNEVASIVKLIGEPGTNGPNHAPSAVTISNSTVEEFRPVGSLVGNFSVTDQDIGDTHSLSLEGPNAANFTVKGLKLLTNLRFDAAVKISYPLTIRCTDTRGASATFSITVTILDVINSKLDPTDGSFFFGEDVDSYGIGQDGSGGRIGSTNLSQDRTAANLQGNAWKKFPLSYNVTENTVIQFTIAASAEGELIMLSLDNDNDQSTSPNRVILIGGRDYTAASDDGYALINPPYTPSGSRTITFPIGTSFTGTVTRLGLIADSDAGQLANVTFSNIRIYESSESYTAWRDARTWTGVPVEEREPSRDPDGDGITNFFEMAFGLNPSVRDPIRYPIMKWTSGSGSAPTLTLQYPKGLPTATYHLEYSANLEASSWSRQGTSTETSTGALASRSISMAQGTSKMFVRLCVETQ